MHRVHDMLLQQVLASPRDDDARLAYASFLRNTGDPHGEFIELQVELAREPKAAAKRARAQMLLAQHRAQWLTPFGDSILDATFHRGFPSLVKVTGATLRARAGDLFRLAPIEHLDVVDLRGDLEPVLSLRELPQLRSLGLANNELDDDAAFALTRAPAKVLRWLDLSCNRLTAAAFSTLVASPLRTQLVHCGLASNAAEDPAERPTDYDEYSQILAVSHPASGQQLEAAHGYVAWLHVHTSDLLAFPPDRFA